MELINCIAENAADLAITLTHKFFSTENKPIRHQEIDYKYSVELYRPWSLYVVHV